MKFESLVLIVILDTACSGLIFPIHQLSENQDLTRLVKHPLDSILLSTNLQNCSTIFLLDDIFSKIIKIEELAQIFRPGGFAIFQISRSKMIANATNDVLARVIKDARSIRRWSACTVLIILSENQEFLETFADESLRGRLLVWSTRLLVFTRLPLPVIRSLLVNHWTYSMMNSMIINIQSGGDESCFIYVYVPYTGDGGQVLRVASCTNQQGLSPLERSLLFPEKYHNFHGNTVNITALPYAPYWIEKRKTSDDSETKFITGTDGVQFQTIAKALNFTYNILPVKSWAEVLQCVEDRTSFIAPVVHAPLPQRLLRVDFTYPHELAFLIFAMGKPHMAPKWLSLYYPLEDEVWLGIMSTLVLVTIFFYMIWYLSNLQIFINERAPSVGSTVELVFGTLFGQPLSGFLPRSNCMRVLVTTWLIFSFIVSSGYRGNLTASLTLPKYPPRPENVEQLVKVVDRITMPPYGVEFEKFFKLSNSEVFHKLSNLSLIVPSTYDGLKRATVNNEAFIDNNRYTKYKIGEHFTQVDGTTKLYIGRQALLYIMDGLPIPHDAPYKAQIDRLLRAISEAGLYEKWSQDVIGEAAKQSRKKKLEQQVEKSDENQMGEKAEFNVGELKALTIFHMQGPIMLWGVGLTSAIIAFALETVKVTR